jgi:CheY-like chemotaxis protein
VDPAKLDRALTGTDPIFNKLTHEREKQIAYLKIALAESISKDNVIVEDCLTFLLPWTVSHILRVCVIANFDYRLEQAVKTADLSEKDARNRLHKDDERITECSSYLFDKSPWDASLYDVVVPMHDRTVDEAVDLICDYATSEQLRTTDRSLQAARNFQLAAAVDLAVAGAGQPVEVHAERGHVTILVNQYTVRLAKLEERLRGLAGKVEGVTEVTVRKGPKYKPPAINPWSDIEGPPKVLLVDDEKDFVHTLSERLKTRDLASSIAYDGEQALSMLEDDAPDVMVLDLMMPGIDGIEVLRRVKREHPHVEVIILTGHGSEHEKNLAEELGAFAYLQKPANVDELARVMREAYARVNERKGIAEDSSDSPADS